MKPSPTPSGPQRTIAFGLPKDWTSEQALAVFELLDDLREMIWNHYQIPIQDLLREQRMTISDPDDPTAAARDPPF